MANLQQQLTEATKRATDAEARVAALTTDLATANERADQAAKTVAEHGAKIDEQSAEIRQLSSSLRAYKGSATRALNQITILKAELSPESRKVGAMRPARDDDEAAARREALDAAFAMGPTQIVFSDGRREIREIAPLIVDGGAWLQTPHHRELNSDPTIEVVGERQQVELAGFGLLNEAGEQVGYCELPSKIAIGRGQHMRLPLGMVRF